MIDLTTIEVGDKVTFFCPRLHYHRTRTVRKLAGNDIIVWHGGEYKPLAIDQIKSHVQMGKLRGDTESELHKEMLRRAVTNEQLAAKSGYAVRTISDIRKTRRFKPQTLADIWQALREL